MLANACKCLRALWLCMHRDSLDFRKAEMIVNAQEAYWWWDVVHDIWRATGMIQ